MPRTPSRSLPGRSVQVVFLALCAAGLFQYGGLANRLSILFELAEWHEKPVAVQTGILAYTTVLEYARDHGETLMTTVEEARRRTIELGAAAEGRIPVAETLEAYTLQAVRYENSDNRHRAAVRVEVGSVLREEVELPWGTYVVCTGQVLGRVVAHEPPVVPISKLMSPAVLPAVYVKSAGLP